MSKNALLWPLLASLILSQPVRAQKINDRALQQISALEREKDARNPAQKKLDSQLIYAGHKLTKGVASPAAPDMEPDVKIHPDGLVLVDITAAVSDDVLKFIEQGGGQVMSSFARYDAIRALMPVGKLEALAARADVRFVARAHEARTNIGSVTGEGDICHRAAQARAAFGVDGTGVRVGVLSDSATFYTTAQSLGDLGPVTILPGQGGSGSGEGTAIMEIIHDLAPGASLYFATAFAGEASFAANINALVASNCSVIVDDVSYFVESPFQDGQPIAQAVKSASDAGVLYFSSAGNSGNKDSGTSGTWEGDFNDGGAAGSPLPTGRVHNFGGGTNYNVVTFIDSPRADLFWADPLGGSSNDYDLYVLNSAGTSVLRSSTTTQSGAQDPYEAVTTLNAGERIVIFKKTAAAARFLHLDTGRCEIAINTAGNVRGHNSSSASNAFCVAAVDVHTSSPFPSPFVGGADNPVETFSSDGPRRIFFQPNGTAITPGNFSSTGGMVFQKPDITAADGASGSTAVPGFSPFYGTSAAAPHAAGIAALLKSFKPLLTPAQMRAALSNSALDIMGAGYDRDSGPGIVMALHALAAASGKPWLLGGTLQLSGGNGNGTVDSNECNNLQFVLQNIGSVTASNVTAVLSTTTTGVNVTQPASAYPDILPGGSATNSPPFNLSTVAGFVSGAPISLTLVSSYTGGANTNTATLTTSQCPTIQTNAGLSISSPTQSGRLGRDGIASGCGSAKTCPGAFTTSPRAYNAHSFTNSTGQSICVTATIATSCDPAGTSNILAVAYLGNFNSASLCTGYLGDPGQSPGPGGLSFAFSVPPLTNFTIVVDAITNGFFCPDYTLSVDGLICPGNGGGQCSVPMLTVTKAGAGNGLVSSTPSGINCGNTCAAGFFSNSVVTLTAAPGTNAAFTGWTGDCTGTGSCIVTMDVNRAVTATFNVAPMVTGASVIPSPNAFNDEPLAITGISTFDGEGDTVSVAYQWQFTTNGTVYVDQAGATNATFVAGSGKLWRCRLTPSDAFNTGTNFLTGAVAVNNQPNLLGLHGQPYSYDSDLFLAATGGGGTFTRSALVNEFSQGASGSKEWVEVLFLKNSDARGWKLFDSNTGTITFSSNTLWSNVTAGTLLVVYNGGDKDTASLPASDITIPTNGMLVIAHSNATYFSGAWIGLGNGGDSISLSDATNALIDGVSYGSNNSQAPALGAVSAGTSASYTNNTESGVDFASNWQTPAASAATPATGNGTVNSNFVANLGSGTFNQMPLFRFGTSGDAVPDLSIDSTNGLVSVTFNAPTGGFYNVVIERYVGTNIVSQQYNLLVGDSNSVYRIPAGKTWAMNDNYTIPGTLIVTGLLDTAGHTLVVSNTLDVSGGTVSNSGTIVYHRLVGSLPGNSLQFNTLPVISAASITPASPVDTDDLIAAVTSASDADNDPVTFAYQWQESSNNIAFTTATLTNAATTQGLFYRCIITPNDGIADGSPFNTVAVQIALDLQILSIESSNTDFVITYSTVSNNIYELQLATDLVLSNWYGIATNVAGNTGLAQFIDIGGLIETQRFYRIRLLP